MNNLNIFCVTDKPIKYLEDLDINLVGVGERHFNQKYITCLSGKNIQKMGGMGKVGMTKKSSVAKHGTWESNFTSPPKLKNSFFILINSSNCLSHKWNLESEFYIDCSISDWLFTI